MIYDYNVLPSIELRNILYRYGFQMGDLIRKNLRVEVLSSIVNQLGQYPIGSKEYNNLEDHLRFYIKTGLN